MKVPQCDSLTNLLSRFFDNSCQKFPWNQHFSRFTNKTIFLIWKIRIFRAKLCTSDLNTLASTGFKLINSILRYLIFTGVYLYVISNFSCLSFLLLFSFKTGSSTPAGPRLLLPSWQKHEKHWRKVCFLSPNLH